MLELTGRTVLVTGATGAVGSAVARRLAADGWRVRALVRRMIPFPDDRVELAAGDITDPASLAEAARDVDCAVHCAAALSSDESLCQRVNVDGTRNLIEALAAGGCARLVHMSSVSVYDGSAGLDLSEESPLWPSATSSYPYGRTKADAERVVAASGLPAVVLRPTPVLSLHPSSFWGPLALERARATDAPIFSWAEMPFVHAENLAEAVVLALRNEAAAGRIYDVVDFHRSTAAFLQAVATAIGRPAPKLAPNAPRLRVAGERIRHDLGYAPTDRFDEFLRMLSNLTRP